jgi:tRNA dimethylallyltransferase
VGKKLIYVAGPTASGKTDVAIALAQWLDTEIISCDSRQFFTELKIGAAPPSATQLAEAKHHFVACRSITQPYTAGQFENDAALVLNQIFEQKDVAILVGGSGLYADALINGFDDLPPANLEIRTQIDNWHSTGGLALLQEKLSEADPEHYQNMDVQNPHRVRRALEVYLSTGKKYSELRTGSAVRHFETLRIVLDVPRAELYARINQRVDAMVAKGLEAEAKSLVEHRQLQTLNTVGYKEWFDFFDGSTSRDEAIEQIKQNTRRYAKRQLTWFRRYNNALWFAPTDLAAMKNSIQEFIDE